MSYLLLHGKSLNHHLRNHDPYHFHTLLQVLFVPKKFRLQLRFWALHQLHRSIRICHRNQQRQSRKDLNFL